MLRLRTEHEAAPTRRLAVPGIQNLGNTCFFNAILQSLAATESFREYLEQVLAQSQQRRHVVPFTKALTECILNLAPFDEHERHATVVPKDLNRALCNKLVAFRGNKQQDSQELLQFLINMVNDEQKECARIDGGLKDFFSSMGLGSITESASSTASSATTGSFFGGSISDICFEESMEERRWNPLYGLQVDLLQCSKCGMHRPMTNRRFLDVSLSFGDDVTSGNRKHVTLWDCLTAYTSPEVISGVECSYCTATEELKLKQRECAALQRRLDADPNVCDVETELTLHQLKEDVYRLEGMVAKVDEIFQVDVSDERCRALHNCFKRLQFSRCPDVFCFHFNRKVFHARSGNMKKLDTHVVFPVELDMSPFCRFEQSANGVPSKAANGFAPNLNGNGKHHHQHHHQSKKQGLLSTSATSSLTSSDRRYMTYELVAVVLHHGNDRYGHFTAFRRVRRTSQWFFISDNTVREATEDEVLASCAYMLFYERKHRSHSSLKSPCSSPNGHSENGKKVSLDEYINGETKGPICTEDEDGEDNEIALARVPDETAEHSPNR